MERSIRRSIVSGRAAAPPSLPIAHRALAVASLANGQSVISNLPPSPSIEGTVSACRSFGADIVTDNGVADIFGPEALAPEKVIDCGESSAALKIFLPLACMFDYGIGFTGGASLSKIPLAPFMGYLERLGATCEGASTSLPLKVTGPMAERQLVYFPQLGAQFFSGILFSSPFSGIGTEIVIDGAFPHPEHAESAVWLMKKCRIAFEAAERDFIWLEGAQQYAPLKDFAVPASSYLSSYLLLAGAIAGKVSLENCGSQDPMFEQLLSSFGAHLSCSGSKCSSSAGSLLGCGLNAAELGRFISHALVLGSIAPGQTKIDGISLLPKSFGRRLPLLIRELSRMGAKISEEENGLVAVGGRLAGAKVEPEGDPMVAMACSIAALAADGPTTISGAECVEKSYPNFFKDLASLGAIVR